MKTIIYFIFIIELIILLATQVYFDSGKDKMVNYNEQLIDTYKQNGKK